jgi:hypothetical protein
MAAPPRAGFSSRAARYILLPAFSAAHRVAMAAPPRVRFAALYLLLGALWLANANTISKIFERCAGLDCFLSDVECRICLEFTGSIGFMSLLLLRVHWQRFSEACEVLLIRFPVSPFLLCTQLDGLHMLILPVVLLGCCWSSR